MYVKIGGKSNKVFHAFKKGLSSNTWCLTSAYNLKFIEECEMCTEKNMLIKTIKKWVNIDLPLQDWVEKIIHGVV